MDQMNMDQMNSEKGGKNDEGAFKVQVEDINNIDKEFSDLQKLKMMNEGAEMQMNQSGALDSHEMEQEEINNRSIFVGNVDYSTQPEELQSLFSECGLINRVTILVNKNTGHSKGYAYIEFADASSVRTALSLSESFFKKRQIKVCSKRRNIPGFNRPKMSPFRGRTMKTTLNSRGRFRQPSFRPFYRGRGAYKKIVTNPYERA
ncbi:RNA-binding protein, putative [Plasmodium ovale]|uniref:RNA-binding protein, putative n=2 Tax=Plasmodium ovale TaxID=36330 RepID=A0A1A8VZX5_PLAOA|nr:RNA-binding protein, putative [Plasmodium ovale curtisi]SBS90954.1 RNA-binding protein, putative [Plasmodium ovale curtisi]SCQ16226.1 RNA-binding protein, putative [Plasmodium ovale]